MRSVLTPSAFLARGLLAGLIAGLITFGVAHTVGEPSVERAVGIEQAHAGTDHDGDAGHAGDQTDPEEVSRADQSTGGLLTGTVAIGLALGGALALVAAAAVGRLGGLSARQTTAVVTLVGFVSFALVPFWKYPANPPAVGRPDTIGARTGEYFGFAAVSVLAAVVAVVAGVALWRRYGAYAATVVAALGYLAVVAGIGELMPTVDEVGGFPADTLWYFRRASIITVAALWATAGVVLVGLLGRLHDRAAADLARRELAASL